MMNQMTEPLTFSVPLSFEAHSLAQKYRQQQISPQKAKQVYLNTLAVYTVDFYLRCLGFETDVKNSDSHNPIALKFFNVADLLVKQIGKLECRPVLPNAQVCQIPLEASSERIAYLVVEMNSSLKQATILGFTQTATAEIPLTQLNSLATFPAYLNKIQQTETAARSTFSKEKTIANLSKWLEGIFEADWQTEKAVFTNNRSLVGVRDMSHSQKIVRRVKLLNLGMQLDQRSVVLKIVLIKNEDEQVSVVVQVHPSFEETFLPSNLKLTLIDESGEILQQVSSNSQDNYIQLRKFRGQTGDRFTLEISLDRAKVTEDFVF
jgi:hypothetical protein